MTTATTIYPLVPLGTILTKSEDWIDIYPDQRYRQVTIKMWGQGVVQRNEVAGGEIAASRRLRVRSGQFVLSRIDARNGALGIVPPELDGAVVSNDFPAFDVDADLILPEYLGWMSRTHDFVELCKAASEGTTNRVRLQEDRFLALTIPLPSLAEQRRVVARIDEVAAKIAEARRLRAEAVEEAEALWRSGLDRFYKDAAETFGLAPIRNLCTSITDGDHLTPTFLDEGVKFIFVGNISSGRLHFKNCKHVSKEYYKSLRPQRKPQIGDILYSTVGMTLGIPVVVDTPEPFCFQRHVAIIKPDQEKHDPAFLCFMLQADTVFRRAWAETTGSAQPTVPLGAIRLHPIPVPPLPEQRRIVAELDALQAKVDALRALQAETAAELDALLPAVLDRAFRGEL